MASIRVKFTLAYLLLIAVMLVIMNTFFLAQSRDMIFESKKSSLQNQAAVISTSLSALDALTISDVRQTMELLDVRGLSSIIVVDDSGNVIYDTTKKNDVSVLSFFDTYLQTATDGNDVFYSAFDGNAFTSNAFSPIVKRGDVLGVAFVHEYDTIQGSFLLGLQRSLKNTSIFITVLAVVVLVYLIREVLTRITKILTAIETVREGEYNYRLEISGNDELAQLGNEFNNLTSRLQETDEMRRRFVADASHELKTPLASIRLLSDSILQNEEMDIDTIRDFVSDIGSESERLTRTTEKLLSLTRMDSHVTRSRTDVDMRNAVSASLRMLQPLADDSHVSLISHLDGGCVINANGDDIHEVVFNLIENAIKYNCEGGSVKVFLRRNGDSAVLCVEDTGVGIPDKDMPYIFDRFYRVDKARSREAGGSGLGLSIVKTTVLEYGGELYAEKCESGGMRFTVSFKINTDDYN